MFVPFSSLPPHARVWIFQGDRPFTARELEIIEERLRGFSDEWGVHGTPFKTSFRIEYAQFIVLAADESQMQASGCSIDSSVRVLKELEQTLGISLFDRNLVAFKTNGSVTLVPVSKLKEKFADGTLNEDTLTFNNLVSRKADFESGWLVAAGTTWLRRYIPNLLAKVK